MNWSAATVYCLFYDVGRLLKVDKAVLKSKLPVVYIGNIAYDVTKQHIEQMLDEVIGRDSYTEVKLHMDKVTGN